MGRWLGGVVLVVEGVCFGEEESERKILKWISNCLCGTEKLCNNTRLYRICA